MSKKLKKIVMIGPVYPYKGGISHYTGLMYRALEKKFQVKMITYKMQYPKFLFKKEQKDYSNSCSGTLTGQPRLLRCARRMAILGRCTLLQQHRTHRFPRLESPRFNIEHQKQTVHPACRDHSLSRTWTKDNYWLRE